jgi:RNA polymerase sigma-70 factor (ECF subfamily)
MPPATPTTTSPSSFQLSPISDEQVVARVVAGDTSSFELLMRRHNQRLFRVARAVTRNDDEAEDVVQETFVRAFAGLAKFQGRSSVVTWLSRIAFHEALRRRRRRRRARVVDGLDPARCEAATEPAEADAVTASETRKVLTEAIDLLPAALRVVVVLRLVEGLSTRETAESLRISESNVKVSLHRARQMLFETIRRRTIPEFRRQFAFDGVRCDRIVATVFGRLEAGPNSPASRE